MRRTTPAPLQIPDPYTDTCIPPLESNRLANESTELNRRSAIDKSITSVWKAGASLVVPTPYGITATIFESATQIIDGVRFFLSRRNTEILTNGRHAAQ